MRALLVLILGMAASLAVAEAPEGVRYVTLQPAFVTNAVSSSDGREQIRQHALTELRDIMQAENGEPVDLVFSNFVVQH